MNNFSKNDYEVMESEKLYQGVFRLTRYHLRHKLFDGSWSNVFKRELLERSSAAAVLPYDPTNDHVILIEQFRPGSMKDPVTPWLVEIPAGIIPKTESAEEVAMHEAMEEAGCAIKKLHPICEYYVSPGGSNEYISIFLGEVNSAGISGVFGLEHENENIRVINVKREEALEKVMKGEIKTSPALVALMWLELNRNKMNWTSVS